MSWGCPSSLSFHGLWKRTLLWSWGFSSAGHLVAGSPARLGMAAVTGRDQLSKSSFVRHIRFCSLCKTLTKVASDQTAFTKRYFRNKRCQWSKPVVKKTNKQLNNKNPKTNRQSQQQQKTTQTTKSPNNRKPTQKLNRGGIRYCMPWQIC